MPNRITLPYFLSSCCSSRGQPWIVPSFLNLTYPDSGTLHFPGPPFSVFWYSPSLLISFHTLLLIFTHILSRGCYYFSYTNGSSLLLPLSQGIPAYNAFTLATSQGSQKCYSPLESSESPRQLLFLLHSSYFLSTLFIWHLAVYCNVGSLFIIVKLFVEKPHLSNKL